MKYLFWALFLGMCVYVGIWIFGPGEGLPYRELWAGESLEKEKAAKQAARTDGNVVTDSVEAASFYVRITRMLGLSESNDDSLEEFLESPGAVEVKKEPKPTLSTGISVQSLNPAIGIPLQLDDPGAGLDPGEREKFCEGVANRAEIRGSAQAVSAGLLVMTEKQTGCEIPLSLEGIVFPSYEQSCLDGYRCGQQGAIWMSQTLAKGNGTELGELVCKKSSGRVGLLGKVSTGEKIQTIGLLRQPTPCENNLASEWTQIWVPVMQCSSWQDGDLSELLVREGWAEAQDPSYLQAENEARAANHSNLWNHGGIQDPSSWSLDFANRQREARKRCLQQ